MAADKNQVSWEIRTNDPIITRRAPFHCATASTLWPIAALSSNRSWQPQEVSINKLRKDSGAKWMKQLLASQRAEVQSQQHPNDFFLCSVTWLEGTRYETFACSSKSRIVEVKIHLLHRRESNRHSKNKERTKSTYQDFIYTRLDICLRHCCGSSQ